MESSTAKFLVEASPRPRGCQRHVSVWRTRGMAPGVRAERSSHLRVLSRVVGGSPIGRGRERERSSWLGEDAARLSPID